MKALIKFLPVDGELDEGDAFMYKKGKLLMESADMADLMDVSDKQKMKPFVVTQDIKTGDKIYCPDYLSGPSGFDNCEVEGDSIHAYNLDRQISTEKKEDCYKIIGDVSDQAIFVKDGLEYEVQGVKKFTGRTEPLGNTVSHEWVLTFEVQCQYCKHYH